MKKIMLLIIALVPLVLVMALELGSFIVQQTTYIYAERIEFDAKNLNYKVESDFDIDNNKYVLRFPATVYPTQATDKTIKYTSSDDSIAIVDDNGMITFMGGYGDVVISATLIKNPAINASCTITVYDDIPHSVKITDSVKEIEINESYRLKAEVLPKQATNRTVTFISSDESVASVSADGTITGLKTGEATITVTTAENNCTDSIKVKVVKYAEGIYVSNNKVITSASSIDFPEYELRPLDANKKDVIFVSSNESIATVDNFGHITFLKEGKVTISVVYKYNEDIKASCEYECTKGHLQSALFDKNNITVDYSLDAEVPYSLQVVPTDYDISKIKLVASSDVLSVDGSKIIIKKGGRCTVSLYEGNVKFDELAVYVKRSADKINIVNDNNVLTDYILTTQNNLSIKASYLPNDTNNTELDYRVLSGKATINNKGKLNISDYGKVVVKVFDKNNEVLSKNVTVEYVADSCKIIYVTEKTLNSEVTYGDIVKFVYSKDNRDYETTLTEVEGVLQSIDNRFKCIGAGSSTIKISADSKTFTYDLFTNKLAESITISVNESNEDIVSANSEFTVKSAILPVNCTENDIKYIVSDDLTASLVKNKLVFKRAGTVTITVIVGSVQDSINVTSTFGKPNGFDLAKTEIIFTDIIEPNNTTKIDNSYFKGITPKDYKFNINDFEITSSSNYVSVTSDGIIQSTGKGKSILTIKLGDIEKYITVYTMLDGALITAKDSVDIPNDMITELKGKEVTYNIDDTSIATVDTNGIVTFKKAGEVNVTCSLLGKTLHAVIESTYGLPKNYTAKVNNTILNGIGSKTNIILSNFSPIDYNFDVSDFSFTAVDNKIVSVDSQGKITALQKGATQVEINCNGIKTLVDIEVKIPLESIDFVDKDSNIIHYVSTNKNIKLNVKPYPANANDVVVKFSSSDSSVADVSLSGEVTFYSAGVVRITASANGKNTYIDVCYFDNKTLIELNSLTSAINVNYAEEYFVVYIDDGKFVPFTKGAENSIVKVNSKGELTVVKGGEENLTFTTSLGSQTINIKSLRKAESIVVDYNGFEIANNTIVTSKNVVNIKANVLPKDTTNKVITYRVISGDAVVDNTGKVTINKAGEVAIELSNNSIKEVVKIKSTLGKPTSFNVQNSSLTIENVGLTHDIVITNTSPSDYVVNKQHFVFESNNEGVATVSSDGKITAISRGKASITVTSGGVVRTINVEVKQKVKSIDITYRGNVIGDCKTYNDYLQLGVKINPLNANNPNYKFSIVSGNGTITNDGNLKLNSGIIIVKVESVDGGASKTISIEKITNILDLTTKYNGSQTTSIRHFADSDCFIEFAVKGENVIGDVNFADKAVITEASGLSTIRKVDNKTIAVGANRSENNGNYNTTINIQINNKSISVDIEFYFATDLRLELNNKDDLDCGLERRRVFGNEFITDTGVYNRTYQFKLAKDSSASKMRRLFYQSSNNNIASINEQGVMTFTGSVGFVTITVCTESDFNPATAHFISSYQFEVVSGVNIYTQQQFKKAFSAHNKPIVFQVDLLSAKQANEVNEQGEKVHKAGTYDVLEYEASDENPSFLTIGDRAGKGDVFYYLQFEGVQDVYGNGHILNINCYASRVYQVKQNGINVKKRMRLRIRSTISNLTLCGYDFDPTKESYSIPNPSVDPMGLRIWLQKKGGTTGATLRYCTIQQFNTAVEVMFNPSYITNCVIRYCTHFGIYQGGDEQPDTPTYYKNLVIDDAGQFAILYQQGKLILDGVIYINNYNTVNDYEQKYRSAMKEVMKSAAGEGLMTADERFNAAIVTMTNPLHGLKIKDNIFFTGSSGITGYDVTKPETNPLNFKMLEASRMGIKVKAWTWAIDMLPPDSAVLEQKIQELYRKV